MFNRLYVVVMLVFGMVMPLSGCRQSLTNTPTPEKLQIMVSIPPQKYFVERIGNGYVNVNVMVPAGAEPHTFEPKPEQLRALSHSQAYMRIRIEFESAWMDKIKGVNPKMLIVDTTQGIKRLPIAPGFHEEGENLDPHIWLSPQLVKIQARTITDTLVKLDTKNQAVYRGNLKRFLADIDNLDADIRKNLQGVKNRKFIVFHPAWGYFARDYGLEIIPIQVGGHEPSAAELAALITKAKKENIKVIFVQPQFSKQAAATIAQEIDGKVLVLDPLSPDWLNNLRQVSHTFVKVLTQGSVFYICSTIKV